MAITYLIMELVFNVIKKLTDLSLDGLDGITSN
jgi:hypothetical protein